jgi:8-oxo-dGTP diphosphatase
MNGELQVALIKRKNPPFVGCWAIPGGFLIGDETVEQAAYRELNEETGIQDIYLQQTQVFSHPERDPRGRVITVSFFALIPSDKIELVATEDAAAAKWWPVRSLPPLAFDHDQIYATALKTLKDTVQLKPIIFSLLPKQFTLTLLQNLYEQIFEEKIDKRNFRRKIIKMKWIQATSKMTRNQQHRPAQLYRFNEKIYRQTRVYTI